MKKNIFKSKGNELKILLFGGLIIALIVSLPYIVGAIFPTKDSEIICCKIIWKEETTNYMFH